MKGFKLHKILAPRTRFYVSWTSVTAHGNRIAFLENKVLTEDCKLHPALSIMLAHLHSLNVKKGAIIFFKNC
jgi:hypothetical protein